MPFMVRCHRNTNAIFVIFHFFIIYYQYSQKCESFFSICDFCTFLKKIILVTDSFSSVVSSTKYKIYIIYLINKHCLQSSDMFSIFNKRNIPFTYQCLYFKHNISDLLMAVNINYNTFLRIWNHALPCEKLRKLIKIILQNYIPRNCITCTF